MTQMSTGSPLIAVFDVDGTLLDGDCLLMAALRSRSPLGLLWAGFQLLPWLLAWQSRQISTGRFKQHTLALFRVCDRVNQAESSGHHDWLLPVLMDHLRPEALQRLRLHQRNGDRVLLCSASPRMLLAPLADALEVELIATELQHTDGIWQPILASPNCKGPEKVRRLSEHLGPLEGLTLEAYGDSEGDREMLEVATIPHYCSFDHEPRPYSK